MIYSTKCIDDEKGFSVNKYTKEAKPNKLGKLVYTIEECHKIMEYRRHNNMIGLLKEKIIEVIK